jgi:hypothetical protein
MDVGVCSHDSHSDQVAQVHGKDGSHAFWDAALARGMGTLGAQDFNEHAVPVQPGVPELRGTIGCRKVLLRTIKQMTM